MTVVTLEQWLAGLVRATTVRDRIDPVAGQHAQRAADRARAIVPVDTCRSRHRAVPVARLPISVVPDVRHALRRDAHFSRLEL